MSGTWGKILRVNLTDSTIAEEAIPKEWLDKYLAGRGIASRYLLEEVPKGADPLGPENELIFMAGLLNGVASPTASKYIVVAKSPLTGIFGMSISGGFWSAKLKRCGLDGIIFTGISPKPVYLVIDEGVAELRDAGHLWGKNTFEVNETVMNELGKGFGVTSIGTAGENLVKYAAIIDNDERAAGRCGLGAVMGSKRLKAIAVKGTSKPVPIADKKALAESEKKHYFKINDNIVKIAQEAFGSPHAVDVVNIRGYLPNKNWQSCKLKDIEHGLGGEAYLQKLQIGNWHCAACSNNCSRMVEVKEGGKYPHFKGRGPEYESVFAWGALPAINDLEAVAWLTRLSNDYGVDTMSCGGTIAFAMECYEKGILTKADTDGIELEFGNADACFKLLPKIARREGFGDMLAEGSRAMARKLGQDTERFAMQVKGLELPGYECRATKIVGLGYATASRGGCHNQGGPQLPAQAGLPCDLIEYSIVKEPLEPELPTDVAIVKNMEDALTTIDCLGNCKFVMGIENSHEDIRTAMANVVGHEFSYEEFLKFGERAYNMERVFSVREGITRADDTLPKRCFEEPLTEGNGKGHVAEIDKLLDCYYDLRGWDQNGIPTAEKLKDLGLEDIVKYLN